MTAESSEPVDEVLLREHSFDGIQEYDHPVPAWLTALFVLSCIWGVLYVGWFHLGPGLVGPERLAAQKLRIAEELAANAEGYPDEPTLRQFSHSAERIAAGRTVFLSGADCVQCHGADALGGIGPNLRDDMWIYGSDMSNLIETISIGRRNPVSGSAMTPYEGRLSRQDIINLAVFIADWNRSQKASSDRAPMDPRAVEAPIRY